MAKLTSNPKVNIPSTEKEIAELRASLALIKAINKEKLSIDITDLTQFLDQLSKVKNLSKNGVIDFSSLEKVFRNAFGSKSDWDKFQTYIQKDAAKNVKMLATEFDREISQIDKNLQTIIHDTTDSVGNINDEISDINDKVFDFNNLLKTVAAELKKDVNLSAALQGNFSGLSNNIDVIKLQSNNIFGNISMPIDQLNEKLTASSEIIDGINSGRLPTLGGDQVTTKELYSGIYNNIIKAFTDAKEGASEIIQSIQKELNDIKMPNKENLINLAVDVRKKQLNNEVPNISDKEQKQLDIFYTKLDKHEKQHIKLTIERLALNQQEIAQRENSLSNLVRLKDVAEKYGDKIDASNRSAEQLGRSIDTNISRIIGYDISRALGIENVGATLASEFQNRTAMMFKEMAMNGKSTAQALKISFSGFSSILSTLLNPWVLAIGAVILLIGLLKSVQKDVTKISEQFGITRSHALLINKEIINMQTNFKNLYVTEESVLSVLTAHEARYGKILDLTKKVNQEQISTASTLGRNFGVAAGEIYDTMQMFQEMGADVTLSEQLTASLGAASKLSGISFKTIKKDLSSSSEYIAKNFSGYPKDIVKTVTKLHMMGTSLEDISKISEKLLDPAGWMSASAELAALTNGNVNLTTMLELKWSGATEEEIAKAATSKFDQLKDQYEGTKQFPLMAKMLANQLDTSVEALQKGYNIRKKMIDLTDDERALLMANVDNLTMADTLNENLMKSKAVELDSMERMNVAWNSIKKELVKALLPTVESLSSIISGLVPVLKVIGVLFKIIGGIIQVILFPINLIVDLIKSIGTQGEKMSNSIAPIAEHFKAGTSAAEKFSGVLKGIGAAFLLIFSIAKFKNYIKLLSAFIPKSFKNIGKSIINSFKGLWGSSLNSKSASEAVVGNKGGIFSKIKEKIGGLFGKSKQDPVSDLSDKTKNIGQVSTETKKVDPGVKIKTFLTNLSSGLSAMGNAKVGKGAWNLGKAAIGFIAMIPGTVGAKFMQIIRGEKLQGTLEGMAKGLGEMSYKKVGKGARNLIPAALGFIAMIPGTVGAFLIQNLIKGESLKTSMAGMGKGLEAFGSGKVFLGILALGLAAVAFTLMIPGAIGMLMFAGAALLVTPALTALGAAITAFGGVIMTGVGALGLLAFLGTALVLAYALKVAAPALEKFKGILEGFGTVVEKFMGGIGNIINSIGSAIGKFFNGLANLIKAPIESIVTLMDKITPASVAAMYTLGPALISLAIGLSSLGAGATLNALGSFLGGDPIKKLEKLSKQADPMYKLADALENVVINLKDLKSISVPEISFKNLETLPEQTLKADVSSKQQLKSNTDAYSNVGSISTIKPSNVPIVSSPSVETISSPRYNNNDNLQLNELRKIRQLLANNTNPEFTFEKKTIEGTIKAFKSNKGGYS